MMINSGLKQNSTIRHEFKDDTIIAGVWLAFYLLAIVSVATTPALVSVASLAAQRW